MVRYIVLSFFLLLPVVSVEGQTQARLFTKKRKKVEVPNYTLFLNLHDLALEYSANFESTIDSLLSTEQKDYHNNLFDFRIRAIQTLQHVLYKSDPVIAYFDGWIFGVQMVNYLESPLAKDYLGDFQPSILRLYHEYLAEWPELHTHLTGESPETLEAIIHNFAKDTPILDNYLNRTSITDAAAQWVGEASIGFKSGVATLTDALRNISDRLNYYTEYSPKLTQWHIEQSVRNITGQDSLIGYLERSISSLEQISSRVDSMDHMIHSVTDTIMTDIDRQRWETLGFFSSERKAVLEQISIEREILFEKMVEERLAVERLFTQEREASLDHFEAVITNTTEYSFDRVDDIIDRLFFRVLILITILAVGLILAVVVYKKM